MFGLLEAGKDFISDPMGTRSIDKGMAAQGDATRQSNEMLQKMYDQQRKDLAPWRDAGLSSLTGMQNQDFQRDFTGSDFQKDPGYEFRLAEGAKALERSAAAKGSVQSGGTLKALSRYNQDFATNEYNNVYNRFNADRDRRFGRLSNIAGMGLNATTQGVNAAGQFGSMYGQNMTNMGNAYAAGNMAKGKANQQLLSSGMSMAAMAI